MSGTLMVLGGTHTAGTMQVLLSQAVIPLTIAMSVVILRKKFHWLQHTGAFIIVLGILCANMLSQPSADSSLNSPLFNAIFFCAMLPAAFSSVYKEVAFRDFDGDLDVNVLQFWVASFQFVTNFLAMPVYALKVLGPQQVPMSEMPALIVGGTRCLFFLEDQVKMNCGLPDEKECDHCSNAWAPVVIYLGFNVLYNIYTMLVIKHGSAALSFLVATLRMPLASIAFASPSIMGNQAVQPGLSDLVSLIVIICGLVTYRYGGRLLKHQMKKGSTAFPALVPGDSPLMSPAGPEPSPSPRPTSVFGRLTEPLRRPTTVRWTFAPLISTGLPVPQPSFVLVRSKQPKPRTADRVRHDLYHRLGAASPLHSPQLRHLAPPPCADPEGMEPKFVMDFLPDSAK
mmetsp:Transcript_32177/g.85700  ORF Transcript_32177/g.85700 Transcript_32177/m.85700 type:complete len:398 (+) Transcript_32177:1-1194(+)